jgi:glycosyltransferase involved in cell wall biosynthesis
MRIVLVEFPPSGGLFQFAIQLGESLARRGHRVEIVTGPRPELSPRQPGCRTRPVLPTWHPAAGAGAAPTWHRIRRVFRGVRHVAAWLVLLALLRVAKPDVVLWSAWRFPIDGWGVQLVRRLLPAATLGIIAHEPRPLAEQSAERGLYKDNELTHRALAGAFRVIDLAFVLGENARSVLHELWPMSAPVYMVPHGDESVFRPSSVTAAPASRTAPRVLFFGTITSYKGLDDLLSCWPMIIKQVPGATLCVAGALSGDVDAVRLRDQVRHLEGIDLRLGYAPISQVPTFFEQARLVALPYRRCSQSGVAHLAYTFARPVVATRVGDIPAVVRHQETGLLVEPGDQDGLVAAISALLRDPAAALRLGEAGHAALDTEASWDTVAAEVEKGLSSVRG